MLGRAQKTVTALRSRVGERGIEARIQSRWASPADRESTLRRVGSAFWGARAGGGRSFTLPEVRVPVQAGAVVGEPRRRARAQRRRGNEGTGLPRGETQGQKRGARRTPAASARCASMHGPLRPNAIAAPREKPSPSPARVVSTGALQGVDRGGRASFAERIRASSRVGSPRSPCRPRAGSRGRVCPPR